MTPSSTTNGRAPDRVFAALVTLAYLAVASFAIAHHEMWRDELHCWLVARDSATPWDVVQNRAYDGQPPLWYLLLWVLQRFTGDPRAMQVAHVAIAVSAVWVFVSRAPFGRVIRALFPFGYFLAYEYVALSRCYGLALLFALLLCDNHPRRFERPVRTACLLAALSVTATVSAMVAAAYAATLCGEWIGFVRRGDRAARRAIVPILAAAAGGFGAAICTWPPSDSTVTHVVWPSELPSDDAPTRLIVALFPIPRVDFFFWNSNALLDYEPFRRVALWVSLALAAWILFVLSRDRAAAWLFGVGALLLVALFGLVYGGNVRHQGFFFVLFLMGAWMVKTSPGAGAPASWRRFRDAALAPTLASVLFAHVLGTPIALYYDCKYVFSSGGRAADVLRARGLADSLIVAELDFPASAVLGELGPHAFAYSPRTGRPFSFVKWTRESALESDRQGDAGLRCRAGRCASRGRGAAHESTAGAGARRRQDRDANRRALRFDDRRREFLHLSYRKVGVPTPMNNLRGSRHAARRTRRPSRAVAGAALLASLTVGCSSSYVPASSPRVSLVMKGGTYSYARDGKEFEGGLFGGEIEEAVRGNPEAEEYARSYKDGMLTGFALSLVGVAAAVGGATVVGASLGQNESNVSSLGAAGLAITTGGLITEIVGLIVEANAVTHVFDAVNAYNDGLLRSAGTSIPRN